MADLLPDRPLTVKELADRWQVSERQVRKLAAKGELSCFRVGKMYRVPQEAVAAYEMGGKNIQDRKGGMDTEAAQPRPQIRPIILLPRKPDRR